PKPEKLYIQMSELLFGGEKGVPALPSPAEREAELRLGERALSRRRRMFRGWRRRPGRGAPVPDDRYSDLDDLLARRDTLLAEREARWAARPRHAENGGPPDDATQELPRIHDPRHEAGADSLLDEPAEPPLRRDPRRPRRNDEEPPHAPPID